MKLKHFRLTNPSSVFMLHNITIKHACVVHLWTSMVTSSLNALCVYGLCEFWMLYNYNQKVQIKLVKVKHRIHFFTEKTKSQTRKKNWTKIIVTHLHHIVKITHYSLFHPISIFLLYAAQWSTFSGKTGFFRSTFAIESKRRNGRSCTRSRCMHST